jgi:D-sedoheptulose 7-phosphate isomerase
LPPLADRFEQDGASLDTLARWTAELIVGGARLLVCGDDGSAALAQHFAAELAGRYRAKCRPLSALALPADGTLLTCLGNHGPPDAVLARQVEGLGQAGDLLVTLSTSGEARKIVAAVETARRAGMHTLALLGRGGDTLAGRAERAWIVPSDDPASIREAHRIFIHDVCARIDGRLHAV